MQDKIHAGTPILAAVAAVSTRGRLLALGRCSYLSNRVALIYVLCLYLEDLGP